MINGKWRHEIDQPQCEDTVVTGSCKTNYDCGYGMTCYNSKCLQSCTRENDCLLDQYCHSDHKVCHDFCESDEECSIGYVCYESECVDKETVPTLGNCATEYDCARGQTCYNQQCLKSCYQENDCAAGQYCHEDHKVCHDYCLSDEVCSIGYICSNSKCVDKNSVSVPGGCQDNYQCRTGMTCHRQKCLPICRQDNDCTNGQYCHDDHKVCHDFCQSDSACSNGYVCHNTRCILPNNMQCTKDNDCIKGFICIDDQRCERSCDVDQHCLEGTLTFI